MKYNIDYTHKEITRDDGLVIRDGDRVSGKISSTDVSGVISVGEHKCYFFQDRVNGCLPPSGKTPKDFGLSLSWSFNVNADGGLTEAVEIHSKIKTSDSADDCAVIVRKKKMLVVDSSI